MSVSIEWLGFAAITLSVLAYLPQITYLIKEHCSAGQEPWSVLHVGGIGGAAPHLFNREERPGFILLQEYQAAAVSLILYFCLRYKGQLCEAHGGQPLSVRLKRR